MNQGIIAVIFALALFGLCCLIGIIYSTIKKSNGGCQSTSGKSVCPEIKIELETKSPFDYREQAIMDYLIIAHNQFIKLPDKHPEATREWLFYFHGLQSILEHRLCKKMYPDYFK